MPLHINPTPILIGALAIAALIVLAVLIKAFTGSKSTGDIPSSGFRVAAKPYFFTKPENAFYAALAPLAQELDLLVFPKVGLNDIFHDTPGAEPGQYNRYSQMHADYLLVTRQDYRPVAGIELSGTSHERERQRTRDVKKTAVFRAARLPLLTFTNGAPVGEVRHQLEMALGRQAPSERVS